MNTSSTPSYEVWGFTQQPNGIGGFVETPSELFSINGFLDLLGGDEKSTNNVFMEESTHILITDYRTDIKLKENWIIDSEGNRFDITLVDDPMQLHRHLEIFLKFVGDRK